MGTMEIQHRSDQGLSWDHGNSLGFSRAFLFLPLRTKHWPLHPSIPYWEHRGSAEECWMSMVRLHQHLWREGDGGSLCDLMSLCTATAAVRGQEWKCTHTVKVSIPTNCQKTGNSVTLTSDQCQHFKAEFKKNCLNNFFFPKWCQKFAPSVFFFFLSLTVQYETPSVQAVLSLSCPCV